MSPARITSCEDAIRLLADHLDRELDREARSEMERHLERCRTCWSRAEFERRLRASLAELGSAPVRPGLIARVDRMLDAFAANEGA
jgi:anti-sigma factor (TIGR02949 family)